MITRKTYSSCADLPVFNFHKIVLTGELNWLFAEPKRPWHKKQDLSELWAEISDEYNELTKTPESIHVFQLIKTMTVINHKLDLIQRAVAYLSEEYNKDLCDMLRKMGFNFKFTKESLINDLRLTIMSAKQLVHNRSNAEKELEAANADSKPATAKDYSNMISQISKYMGFHIDTKQTTVVDLISYIDSFKNENKLKSASNGK